MSTTSATTPGWPKTAKPRSVALWFLLRAELVFGFSSFHFGNSFPNPCRAENVVRNSLLEDGQRSQMKTTYFSKDSSHESFNSHGVGPSGGHVRRRSVPASQCPTADRAASDRKVHRWIDQRIW